MRWALISIAMLAMSAMNAFASPLSEAFNSLKGLNPQTLFDAPEEEIAQDGMKMAQVAYFEPVSAETMAAAQEALDAIPDVFMAGTNSEDNTDVTIWVIPSRVLPDEGEVLIYIHKNDANNSKDTISALYARGNVERMLRVRLTN